MQQPSPETLSMLAHELKGPLANVMGFASALRDEFGALPEGRRAHFLELIVREARRLSRLVDDLLDASSLENGTLCCDLHAVDLRSLVYRTLEANSSLAARHDVVLDVPELLPPVLADEDRISQVLINLISNATRYSPEGCTITVRARLQDGEVIVEVADEGIGIAPEQIDKVFDKFARVDKPDGIESGNGLGLFISRGVVAAHGGNLWVESEPGNGSTFHFTLRVAA